MSEQTYYEKLITANDRGKKAAGENAVNYIEDGMTLGLGSGSTVYWALKKLSEQVKQGLNVKGIPSSKRTESWAKNLGIPLTTFHEIQELDLAIDGADEIDANLHLLKGGGGSLVREKIVNTASKRVIIIADQSKRVAQLGNRPLPVEVLPFGWEVTAKRISHLGAHITLRDKENQPFISDNGNYILDCQFPLITDPAELHNTLIQLVGVVETGLFVELADRVILGQDDELHYLEKPKGGQR
ncbi:ribose-5-phosphate isomerase [Halobacillus karajensis]|uniref:Ribose-5-phosphate isomerase A n=1 Tax=Halobacillus karajensis TaxID=195088 RepID=A0A024P8N7_9BACI|nr:ribose-5-phosphate isomerase RpiA [Halobacillus karajensis]CDQ20231.1 Ribose-5-phosphate isomerase A [Halobacillus karajensis]CDQ25106.1 Ribose-5-phosphate isomerase A [Halobacillus karajensis]CDQ28533.1 Ribose-5-phosphate isomerase A [Halobacillus karajensis]SEI02205.1 ribose-5-phosphate isomerase [Halobacillus karajensis]